MRWWRGVGAGLVTALALPGLGQELQINEVPYDEVAALEPVIETFEGHARFRIGSDMVIDGAKVGQILAGQGVRRRTGRGLDDHWVLDGTPPLPPLELGTGSPGTVAMVAWDEAFRSFALAGIGPPQSGAGRARLGTGIVTVLFDEPQCLFGLRVWLDGMQENTVMRDFPEGNLNVIFWNEAGETLANFRRFTDQGLVEIAYIQSAGTYPEIRAVTVQNLDPGGIGIDEILYAPLCPMIVSGLGAGRGPAS